VSCYRRAAGRANKQSARALGLSRYGNHGLAGGSARLPSWLASVRLRRRVRSEAVLPAPAGGGAVAPFGPHRRSRKLRCISHLQRQGVRCALLETRFLMNAESPVRASATCRSALRRAPLVAAEARKLPVAGLERRILAMSAWATSAEASSQPVLRLPAPERPGRSSPSSFTTHRHPLAGLPHAVVRRLSRAGAADTRRGTGRPGALAVQRRSPGAGRGADAPGAGASDERRSGVGDAVAAGRQRAQAASQAAAWPRGVNWPMSATPSREGHWSASQCITSAPEEPGHGARMHHAAMAVERTPELEKRAARLAARLSKPAGPVALARFSRRRAAPHPCFRP